jgi:hypothetical protein
MVVKVKVKKENDYDSFYRLPLSLTDQEQLNLLVAAFLEADLETRDLVLRQLTTKK